MVMFWVALLAISMLMYLLLDGFDLGVGMLFGLSNSEANRSTMQNTVAPVWDGNETWLIVDLVGRVSGRLFDPVIRLLYSRGYHVAGADPPRRRIRISQKTQRLRWIWNVSFAGGSFVASFMQGVTVGALAQGLRFTDGQYSGGVFGWFSDFSVLCGAGLCLGYALLGACWLVRKCDSEVRDVAGRQIPILAVAVLAFLVVVFIHALTDNLPIMHRWIDRPYLFVFPAIGAVAAVVLASSILHHNDYWPFQMVSLMFVAAFGTLALSFWPYMIPFAITIDAGAAPHSSLAFMFWGEGLFVFPLMLLYAAVSYRVFRGKLGHMQGHY